MVESFVNSFVSEAEIAVLGFVTAHGGGWGGGGRPAPLTPTLFNVIYVYLHTHVPICPQKHKENRELVTQLVCDPNVRATVHDDADQRMSCSCSGQWGGDGVGTGGQGEAFWERTAAEGERSGAEAGPHLLKAARVWAEISWAALSLLESRLLLRFYLRKGTWIRVGLW